MDNELNKLLQIQLDVCKEAVNCVDTSAELLKAAVLKIKELEEQIAKLKSKKNKKKKSKKE